MKGNVKMGFRAPHFNLDCNIWNDSHDPATDPPDVTSDCQLYFPKQEQAELTPGSTALWRSPIYLRLPAGTDIRFDPSTSAITTQVECPAGSGRFYAVNQVDDAHKGFPNEYRVAVMQPHGAWPSPIP